jgi:hypothetical protein
MKRNRRELRPKDTLPPDSYDGSRCRTDRTIGHMTDVWLPIKGLIVE